MDPFLQENLQQKDRIFLTHIENRFDESIFSNPQNIYLFQLDQIMTYIGYYKWY